MQTKRPTRDISGVFLLNKSAGASSNYALQQVKRLYQASKAGHTGSLDPLASGVLPICFGDATKFSRFLLDADKVYQVTAKLGEVTSTADEEGEIIATYPVPDFSVEDIQKIITSFMGASKQVPSMYSALKHNGQPLYKLARLGLTIERAARDIFIYQFDLLAHTKNTLTFRVKCSKGTYIRNLIEDFGAQLGCGAHVSKLERTEAGQFTLENSHTFEQLNNNLDIDVLLLPAISLIKDWPQVNLNSADTAFVRNGRSIITPPGIALGWVALIGDEQQFLGAGEALNDGYIVPRRLIKNHSV